MYAWVQWLRHGHTFFGTARCPPYSGRYRGRRAGCTTVPTPGRLSRDKASALSQVGRQPRSPRSARISLVPDPQELPRYDPIGEGRANSSGLVNPGRLLAPSPTSEWSELARGTIRPVGVIGRDKATCTGRLLSHFACLKGATCFWFSPAPRMARSPAVALGNGESDPSSWSSALPRRFLGNWTKSHF